jgi:hypothetical protein
MTQSSHPWGFVNLVRRAIADECFDAGSGGRVEGSLLTHSEKKHAVGGTAVALR